MMKKLICALRGCSEEAVNYWGEDMDYVLWRCTRCGKETILCSKEMKLLDNDEEGRRALEMMMGDPEFSRRCTIHSEFVKFVSEKDRDQVRRKYGLGPKEVPDDPVELLRRGFWKSGPEAATKSKSGPGQNPKGGEASRSGKEMTIGERIASLQRRIEKHVLREEYEKASKVSEELAKLREKAGKGNPKENG